MYGIEKFVRFSGNEFWKNIGCLISTTTFGLGGFKAVVERRGFKAKWKEEEETFNSGKG